MLPAVTATRYVTPLREGGSLPGLMEADDLGTYVVKWRAAGQGVKVLVAEVVCGELARGARAAGAGAGDRRRRARSSPSGEPDVEVQELLQRSAGRNLGLDYLPGALDFEAGADGVDPGLAGRVLWFDALVGNVDRSWRNPNMLFWHGRLQLIDHGAALTFHHNWPGAAAAVARPYDASPHALLECEPEVPAADAALAGAGDPAAARRRARRRCPTSGWTDDDAATSCRARGTSSSCSPGWPRATSWLPGVVAAARGRRRRAPPHAARGEPAGLARAAAAGGGHAAMTSRETFEYAVLRVVPRVERGEALNAGVLVYCRQRDYLGSRVHLDVDRLRALDPTADADGDRPRAAGGRRRLRGRARVPVPPGGRRSGRGSAG